MANGTRGRKSDSDLAQEMGITVEALRENRKNGAVTHPKTTKVNPVVRKAIANYLQASDMSATLDAEEQNAVQAVHDRFTAKRAEHTSNLASGMTAVQVVATAYGVDMNTLGRLLESMQSERLENAAKNAKDAPVN